MLFSSFVFLFVFLPFSVIAYLLLPNKCRNLFLLLISLFFYGWGEPIFLRVILVSILWNYGFGLLIARYRTKLTLTLGAAGNLALLFHYKYLNFAADIFSQIRMALGAEPLHLPPVVLPIGISFFTFQGLSYLIDVYRNPELKQKNLLQIGLYISLFPQLIAGPIIRWEGVREEILHRTTSLADLAQGLRQFLYGLGSKVIIANSVGAIADRVFDSPQGISTWTAWFGALAYTMQIYYDFSGYSNMAIGLGRMFGFHFPANFNYPYMASSISDFWRRWHISLSQWFRDYVYIPLGGSRRGEFRTACNLLIVFALTGFWHGAEWSFIVWGLWYGVLLVVEKFVVRGRCPALLWRIFTLFAVVIGWVFFRCATLRDAWNFLGRLFHYSPGGPDAELYSVRNCFFMICACAFAFPWVKTISERKYVGEIVSLGIFFLSIMMLARTSYNPFLYFRF